MNSGHWVLLAIMLVIVLSFVMAEKQATAVVTTVADVGIGLHRMVKESGIPPLFVYASIAATAYLTYQWQYNCVSYRKKKLFRMIRYEYDTFVEDIKFRSRKLDWQKFKTFMQVGGGVAFTVFATGGAAAVAGGAALLAGAIDQLARLIYNNMNMVTFETWLIEKVSTEQLLVLYGDKGLTEEDIDTLRRNPDLSKASIKDAPTSCKIVDRFSSVVDTQLNKCADLENTNNPDCIRTYKLIMRVIGFPQEAIEMLYGPDAAASAQLDK